MKKILRNTSMLALAAMASAAYGQSLGSGDLSIGGFGTLGVARTNTDLAQFVRYNQAEGVTTKEGIGTDSNLGLQATYKFDPTFSATAQVLTRKNTSPTFTTDLTWAFVKARINDDFSARLGRIALPVFMISDYQNVGYSNTMIRPPIELYGQVPVEAADGADLSYQHSFGDTTVSGQAIAGTSKGKLFVAAGGGSVAHYRAPMVALSMSVENGPLLVRFSHLRTKFGSDDFSALNGLVNTLSSVGFAQLGKDMAIAGGKKIEFTAIGATLDWHNIMMQGEFGARRSKEPVYVPDNNAWYLMAGYRVGKFLPYYTHSDLRQVGRTVTLPANFPKSGPLFAGVDTAFLTAPTQRTDIIGMRWDFAKSLALKLQVDRVHPKTKTGALIFGPAAGLTEPVTVFAVAIDAVF
ncbi:MAG: porin [Pseudomonadota bacterium]